MTEGEVTRTRRDDGDFSVADTHRHGGESGLSDAVCRLFTRGPASVRPRPSGGVPAHGEDLSGCANPMLERRASEVARGLAPADGALSREGRLR
jgi:hypothetical protein